MQFFCVLKIAAAVALATLSSVGSAVAESGQAATINSVINETNRLDAEAQRLFQAGKYAEGEPLEQRALAIGEKALGPEHPQVAQLLNNLANLYRTQGRYADAEPLYKRSLSVRERALGAEHPDVATSLSNLGSLYRSQDRYGEAEPLFKRSLAIREKVRGPSHPDVAKTLEYIAELYELQSRFADAEPLRKRSLEILKQTFGADDLKVANRLKLLGNNLRLQNRFSEAKLDYLASLSLYEKALGPEHLDVAAELDSLASLYYDFEQYREVESLYKRSLAIREKLQGPNSLNVAALLNRLALVYDHQDRYREAEQLYLRSLSILEKVQGPVNPDVATELHNLGTLYRSQGRFGDSERLFARQLAIREETRGLDHPDVAEALGDLASIYEYQGRYADAEKLYQRSLAIIEKVYGPDSDMLETQLTNSAKVYSSQSRWTDAEILFKRALAIREKLYGADHGGIVLQLWNLGSVYQEQRRYSEAELIYKRALLISEKVAGPDHEDVAQSLLNIADLYRDQGRFSEAEPLYNRSLVIREKAHGRDSTYVAQSLDHLAALKQLQGLNQDADRLYLRSQDIMERELGPNHPDIAEALDQRARRALVQKDLVRASRGWESATKILQRRTEQGVTAASERSDKGEIRRNDLLFKGLVKTTFRLVNADASRSIDAAKMFEAAQWAQTSEAAAALAQMAVRSAAGKPELAEKIANYQALASERNSIDAKLVAARSGNDIDTTAINALRREIADKDAEAAALRAQINKDFPDFAALSSTKPVSISGVQATLREDEALVLLLDTGEFFKPLPEETFLWVVTKNDLKWSRVDLGTAALEQEVSALRCGLDRTVWEGAGGTKCAKLLELAEDFRPSDGTTLPFSAGRAHALYKSLFGDVEEIIKAKQLLVVPSGALTQLPFHVLVTSPPLKQPTSGADYRDIAWLAKSHAITVLPAVSSLTALRRDAKSPKAFKAYAGFGNPLLFGAKEDHDRAQLAQSRKSCPVKQIEVADASSANISLAPIQRSGALASLAELSRQRPLPETAEELWEVAEVLGGKSEDVRLGLSATEEAVKKLSGDGKLKDVRVLHFATHGTLAGQMKGSAEPGLILTPPDQATEKDDGYLTASEIAGLNLDADWVILSACNTAGGGASEEGLQAMSGMARAFFYAGARALLVSHWAVNSKATVTLVTKAVAATSGEKPLGRAKALQAAMKSMIESGAPNRAHPAYWAPFVVVGEGGAPVLN